MECRDVTASLDAYLDGELAPERAASLEAHARTCTSCAGAISERRELQRAAAELGEFRPAPPALRESVTRRLAEQERLRVPRRAPAWAWLSVAASVVLAGSTLWLGMSRSPGARPDEILLRDAVSSHIRSMMASHLADIAVSDQHTVKPWFAGRLDFSPTVVDHAADGFPLTGGRLDYVGGRPVAAVVYTRRAHVINLFVCPDPSGRTLAPRAIEDRGYHAFEWAERGMRYCAVSDLNRDELEAFVRTVRAAE